MRKESTIDWQATGKPDGLYGTGATTSEKALALGTAVLGTGAVVGLALIAGVAWEWWQWAIAVVIAFDLLGGVVTNALNSAKREHFAGPGGGALAALARRPVLFAAVHVQPVIVALVFPPHGVWWGIGWYAAVLLAVVAVRAVPLYLERPTALAACVAVALAAASIPAPAGFAWLPVIMVLKLALAHAVQEEPYRPTR